LVKKIDPSGGLNASTIEPAWAERKGVEERNGRPNRNGWDLGPETVTVRARSKQNQEGVLGAGLGASCE